MGTLGNFDHERFCQAAHKRIWSGEQRKSALTAAYIECIFDGEDPNVPSVADNARKLANRPDVKGRMAELADFSAKLAGIDANWAVLRAKRIADFDATEFLAGRGDLSDLPGDVEIAEEAAPEPAEGEERAAPKRMLFKTKIKAADRLGAIAFMAKLMGWEAPKKTAFTDTAGNSLETLVVASMKPKESAPEAA